MTALPDIGGVGHAPPSRGRDLWRRYRRNRAAMLGLVLLALVLAMAATAGLIEPDSCP